MNALGTLRRVDGNSRLGIQVVKHCNKDRFRSRRNLGGTKLKRSMVAEHNVLQDQQCIGGNTHISVARNLACHRAEHDDALHGVAEQISFRGVTESTFPREFGSLP